VTRQQREFERLANETERRTAELAADAYESAAREARTVAADIGRAESATDRPPQKRPAPRKKR